jgi:protein required for attachment to host cells
MSRKLKIPRDGLVLVCDGRKALMLRNRGDDHYPNLQVERVLEASETAPTHLLGSDKPPRTIMAGQRSTIEQTDWHDLAEQRFAGEVASALEELCRQQTVEAIVVVAPPRTLAELRKTLPEQVSRRVTAEIDKDLTKHPVYEIEQYLTGG